MRPTNKNDAVIQRLKVSDAGVRASDGNYYAGVRFTLPEWTDGDLKWVYFHLNSEQQAGQRIESSYGIVAERGELTRGRDNSCRIDRDRNAFWEQYPFTRRVYALGVPRYNLKPGREYAIYFGHLEQAVPDIAFALTIDSERGEKEFGSLDFISGPTWIDNKSLSAGRAFLQRKIARFPEVGFKGATNGDEAVFQRHVVRQHLVGELEGRYYTGVRFTVPAWVDGSLELAFVHLYRPTDLPRRSELSFKFNVTAERGTGGGVNNYEEARLSDLPELDARFQTSGMIYTSSVSRENLTPGQTYVLWWAHSLQTVPDIAFALSIVSERGRREFGAIKLH